MKTIINSLLFYFLSSSCLCSQTNIGIDIDSDLSVSSARTYSIGTFDNRETSYQGSTLLWENWMMGTLMLEGNRNYLDKEYYFNYDALSNLLYVRIGHSVYDIILQKVNSLNINTSLNETALFKVLEDENSEMSLYEILYTNEEMELVKRFDVQVVKGHYNTALDAGDVRSQLKKSEILYFHIGDKLYEIPKKLKKFALKYRDNIELKEIVKFFNKNRVNLKNEEEIRSALIDFNKNK